jgi:TetR/AcrR family transcriptional regulator, copper-responsive repressor
MAGRHRSFDKEEVLGTAMKVFWQNGYAGTSMSDLTGATGLTKPSLYAAYGNKEDLFRQSLHRYIEEQRGLIGAALHEPGVNLMDRIANYLKASARRAGDPSAPGGCFVLASTCEADSEAMPAEARQTVIEINARTNSRFSELFRDEQKKGHVDKTASPELLADHLSVLQAGLVMMAKKGADPQSLERLIDHAISTWPMSEPRDARKKT